MNNHMVSTLLKLVWVPCFAAVFLGALIVLVEMAKQTGWDVPFRWLCLAGLVAFIIDCYFMP